MGTRPIALMNMFKLDKQLPLRPSRTSSTSIWFTKMITCIPNCLKKKHTYFPNTKIAGSLDVWAQSMGCVGCGIIIHKAGQASFSGRRKQEQWSWKQSPAISIKNHKYHSHYLVDGIYPPWSTLVKTISHSQDNASKHYEKLQDCAQKDIKCTFGVLQVLWEIIKQPCQLWDQAMRIAWWNACVILENIIVELKRKKNEFIPNTSAQVTPNHHNPVLLHTISGRPAKYKYPQCNWT